MYLLLHSAREVRQSFTRDLKRMATPEKSDGSSNLTTAPTGAEPSSAFPSSIPLEDICKQNEHYHAALYSKYRDLYEGGEHFKKHIGEYLVKRQIEESAVGGKNRLNQKSEGEPYIERGAMAADSGASIAGAAQWEARKKRAFYVPHVAGMIDHMVSAAHYEEPEIKSENEYYKGLNASIDGAGKDISVQSKEAMTDLLVYNRPFLAIRTPELSVAPQNQDEAKRVGANNCMLSLLPTKMVDDWCEQPGMEFVRTHREDYIRSTPYKQPDRERHLWTYITKDALYEYGHECERGTFGQEKVEVSLLRVRKHQFGRLPVVPIKIHSGLWAMQRLEQIALARFNRRSSLTWSLDLMAFALMVLSTGKTISSLELTDFGALMLESGDSANFIAPNVQIIGELFKDDDSLRGDMYEVLNAMGLLATQQPENARQSAKAKNLDMQPLGALLKSCAHAVTEGYKQALASIEDFRGDTRGTATLFGMTNFDTTGLTARIDNAMKLKDLPNFPSPASDWQMYEMASALCKNAPPEIRTKLDDWFKKQLSKPVEVQGGGTGNSGSNRQDSAGAPTVGPRAPEVR